MLDLTKLPKTQPTGEKTGVNVSAMLSGLNVAQVFEQGQYFTEPGEYLAEVEECLVKRGNISGAPLFIVKFRIKSVISPGGTVLAGQTRSIAQKLTDTNVAFPVLKQFALACLNPGSSEERVEAEQLCESALEAAADPNKQAFKGTLIRIVTVAKTTKKGQLIHVANFHGVQTKKEG